MSLKGCANINFFPYLTNVLFKNCFLIYVLVLTK